MENDIKNITKKILILLNNNHTIIKENDSQTNYYNFVTDTIYLSKELDNSKNEKGLGKANPFCGRLVTICHECVHAIQHKWLHILNLVLSNLSIICTIITLTLMLMFTKPMWWKIFSIAIIITAILARMLLEIEAIIKSIGLAEKAVEKINIGGVEEKDIEEARSIIRKLIPLQLVKMNIDKIVMLIIAVI